MAHVKHRTRKTGNQIGPRHDPSGIGIPLRPEKRESKRAMHKATRKSRRASRRQPRR
jgi:hypothetical protein